MRTDGTSLGGGGIRTPRRLPRRLPPVAERIARALAELYAAIPPATARR